MWVGLTECTDQEGDHEPCPCPQELIDVQEAAQSKQDSEYGRRGGGRGIVVENKLHCSLFGLENKGGEYWLRWML